MHPSICGVGNPVKVVIGTREAGVFLVVAVVGGQPLHCCSCSNPSSLSGKVDSPRIDLGQPRGISTEHTQNVERRPAPVIGDFSNPTSA